MTTNGLPNDILSFIDPISIIIFIPLCDHLLYPFLQHLGLNFSPLKKITCGFGAGAMAMVWAAILQHYIYRMNPCGYRASSCLDATTGSPRVSKIHVLAQTGAYVLIAFSEIFASVTGLEYAFTKAPTNMRSLVTSAFLLMSAVSSAISQAFVTLSADPFLVWNYGVLAVLAGVAAVGFWVSVRKLDAQEDELNWLKEGHFCIVDKKDDL